LLVFYKTNFGNKGFKPRLCGSLDHFCQKMVLGEHINEFNPDKYPLFRDHSAAHPDMPDP
jgi:hypothetical protein